MLLLRKYFRNIICICAVLYALTGFGAQTEPPEDIKIALIAKLAPYMLAQAHYLCQPFDDSISSKTFDGYFELLDPQKVFFTQEDIRKFEPYRFELDNNAASGDTTFAFAVYDLYVDRLEMYRKFAEETLKTPFDFSGDETIELDRKDAPYCADLEELKKYWYKKLKSEVLYQKLIKRSMEYSESNPDMLSDLNEDERKKLEESKKIAKLWARAPEEQVLQRLRDVNNELTQSDRLSILGIYLTALARSYGPHSDYMPPAMDENFDISMRLSLYGIGATLTTDDGYIKIVELVPGGPAAKEGTLQPGDRIIAVAQDGGEPVDVMDMSLDRAVSLIRGEEGTKVTLTFIPGSKGRGAMPEFVTITRGKVELKDSEAKGKIHEIETPDGVLKIGVITLDSFYMDFESALAGNTDYKSCTRDVKKILEDFESAGVAGVVMDMRNNGGGSLPEAISLSGLFIKKGPIVQVRQPNSEASVEFDEDSSISYAGPLVILTSKLTSSAAEIFSGAMKDYQRGLIIGDSRTYGKGTVLEVAKLERVLQAVNMAFPAGSLKFESAIFYRINGESTQEKGIAADIVFPSFTENMELGEVYSKNHLPWDAISPAKYQVFDPDFAAKKAKLVELSEKRIASNPAIDQLKNMIAKADERRRAGEVSLNEEKRFKEYLADVKEAEILKESRSEDASGERDLMLGEAFNVLKDWVALEKQ